MEILVPDVIPNNLKIIRTWKGLRVKDLAESLKVDRNFLSAIETNTRNMSGKTTIRTMKLLNSSFYKLYDIRDSIYLPVTKYEKAILENVKIEIPLRERYIKDGNIDIPTRTIKYELQKALLKDYNKKGKILNYEVLENKNETSYSTYIMNIEIDEEKTVETLFDINFLKNENKDLYKNLEYRKGFNDTIVDTEITIDGMNNYIDGNIVVLDKEYKIPNGKSLIDFDVTNKVSLDNVKITKVPESEMQVVKFKIIDKEMNTLKAIRALTNYSINDMRSALDMSYNAYVNLEQGNQKISTKIMWRMVYLLKIPLEMIVNIDAYYDKYCIHENKITRPRVDDYINDIIKDLGIEDETESDEE